MTLTRARAGLCVGLAAMAGGGACRRPEAPRPAAASDSAVARPARDAGPPDVYVPAVPAGPTGTVEVRVVLDGPIRTNPALQVPSTWASRPGCRDAAQRYSSPFDVSSPGPFPGALVFVEARESSPPPVRDVVITFRDCDIVPRVVFATMRDRIMLHSDARESHFPTIQGAGAAIDMLLGPSNRDVERHVTHPGRYPVTARDLPEYTQSLLFVLANRFMATSNAEGVGRVTEVPVGRHLVHAWYPGTMESHEVVEVRDGEIARLELHLRQAAPPPVRPAVDAGSAEIPP